MSLSAIHVGGETLCVACGLEQMGHYPAPVRSYLFGNCMTDIIVIEGIPGRPCADCKNLFWLEDAELTEASIGSYRGSRYAHA